MNHLIGVGHNSKQSMVCFFTKSLSALAVVFSAFTVQAELGPPEKDELKFGFIKLTDMAPIAVAYENGYFEDEGLYVTVEAQAN